MTTKNRRLLFLSLVASTMVLLLGLFTYSLSLNGISLAEFILLACFMITLPWTVIGFWNAIIGLGLLRLTKNAALHVFPDAGKINGKEKITASTALAMCIRNEDVEQVARNMNAMIARLVASGNADQFHAYILSDSSFPEVMSEEDKVFSDLKKSWAGKFEVTYRRRKENPGFKAGNIRDFCDRWGSDHDYMLTLDADSVMSASTILRMVRIMQKNDKLGIVQSLVVGLPSDSTFSRVFQFGMRMGMKSYTLGSAWWQADCGPYWGHNALLRLKPFIDHCHLPILKGEGPLSGYVLSHDQVEATFMRRAGYECRVLAEEGGSYEENPPHILEFIRRDLRWCHGNMQYFKLLNEPGLLPTSRIQLLLAILMFVSSPAWMMFIVVAMGAYAFPAMNVQMQAVGTTYLLYFIIMGMIFAPKIASLFDTITNSTLRKSYGGTLAILSGAFMEIIFSMLLAPIMAVANTIFLFKLFVLKKAKGWTAQSRSAQSLPIDVTSKHLWPQTLFGLSGLGAIAYVGDYSATTLIICLPVFVGPLLAVPFGVLSSILSIGKLTTRMAFCQLPEEKDPPVIMRALNLPAVVIRGEVDAESERYKPLTTEQLVRLDIE